MKLATKGHFQSKERENSISLKTEECKSTAFTLAEMLIALAVIGIVAALTLPTLMTTISNKIKENQMEVFERKISKGTDLLNIENGIGPYYTSSTPSYEFAQALSKHLKIATICDKNNLKKCFNYDYIQTDMGDKNITDIKTGEDLQLNKNDYTDVAGIVLGDGTPMIFSWNKNCPVSDPDTVNKGQTTACIQGIYDLNGSKGPNKFGKDIVGFNAGHLGWIDFAGMKIAYIKKVTALQMNEYCDEQPDGTWEVNSVGTNLGIQYCYNGSDAWAGGLKHCKNMGAHLTTDSELTKIAKYAYNIGENDNFNESGQNKLVLDKSKFDVIVNGDYSYYGKHFFYSSTEIDSKYAQYRLFDLNSTSIGHKFWSTGRSSQGNGFICVKN